MSARNRILLRDLWHLRGQVTAAALVVACGIAAFVSMRGTYESLLYARADYYHAFRFADVFATLERAPLALIEPIAAIPGVAAVQPRVVRDVTLDVPGLDEPATGRLVSLPEHHRPALNDLHLRRGRFVEPGRADQVVASEAFAAANGLRVGDRIGAVINGRWKPLTIVGVGLSPEYIYEVGGGTIFPDNRRFGVLWMGEEALAAAFDMDGAFNDVAIGLAAGATEGDVIAAVDRLLAPYGGLGAYGRDEQVSHRFISDEIAQNRVASTYLPGIFLGVAAFLLHTVLSRLVGMQRAQIGLLKAFGYRDGTVGAHYLKLAAVIAIGGVVVGTVVGVRLGTALTGLYREYYRFPRLDYHASAEVLGTGIAISLAAAGIGALGAVRRAAALPPAEAMRPEPPATFHAGALEWSGMARWLPASVRMIARNVGRHPVKSALTVLGIACAVGLLVVGGFFLDAIDYLMKVQFEVVQRDDLTVLFTEGTPARARYDVRRLPGVLRTEPFRTVPVRVRAAHRRRRVELTGLAPEGDLHRLIDARLRTVDLPPEGVVLTRTLADVLHVSPGDVVTIEALAGKRPVREVPVTRTADELVGVGAYMDRRALDRFMRDEETISGAHLAVDPEQTSTLYHALKQMPAVRAVAIRRAVVESFQAILQRSLVTSMTINALFACVIAFGVVYNGARIALSERGNELASLRVLGFTRREAAVILLGEQALFTLAALPLGFALGVGVCWLLARRLTTELYRLPLVLRSSTFAFAAVTVLAATVLTGMVVRRRLDRLDLIAVLKTRE